MRANAAALAAALAAAAAATATATAASATAIATSFMARFFRIFSPLSALALIALLFACSGDRQRRKPTVEDTRAAAGAESFSLAHRELMELVQLQKNIEFDGKTKKAKKAEIESRLLELDRLWENYMLENGGDLTSLLIYGKFLRAYKDAKHSYEIFLKADKIDPNIAVVKQQLALYEAENKDYAAAYEHILRACELEPKTAVYRYQLGNLIFYGGSAIAQKKFIAKDTLEAQMLEAFKSAASLDKSNAEFLMRHAQAYYEVSKPDWAAAMAAWKAVFDNSKEPQVRENALLNMAQIAMETSDFKEAEKFLSQVGLPDFNAQKAQIERRLKELKGDSAKQR